MRDQWIEWLQEKQRHFFYGVILVVATFFLAFQLFGKFHKPARNHYFTADQAFEKWMHQGEAFEKLEIALSHHPELETKFGALIADKFIGQNEGDKAQPFAQNVFSRVLKQTPEHTAFAEGSLLIAKGNFRDALSRSISLKDRLGENTLLYGFNLVRIASLYRALELRDQEIASLEDLERFMQRNISIKEILNECFCEGELTLVDYISQRKSIK